MPPNPLPTTPHRSDRSLRSLPVRQLLPASPWQSWLLPASPQNSGCPGPPVQPEFCLPRRGLRRLSPTGTGPLRWCCTGPGRRPGCPSCRTAPATSFLATSASPGRSPRCPPAGPAAPRCSRPAGSRPAQGIPRPGSRQRSLPASGCSGCTAGRARPCDSCSSSRSDTSETRSCRYPASSSPSSSIASQKTVIFSAVSWFSAFGSVGSVTPLTSVCSAWLLLELVPFAV